MRLSSSSGLLWSLVVLLVAVSVDTHDTKSPPRRRKIQRTIELVADPSQEGTGASGSKSESPNNVENKVEVNPNIVVGVEGAKNEASNDSSAKSRGDTSAVKVRKDHNNNNNDDDDDDNDAASDDATTDGKLRVLERGTKRPATTMVVNQQPAIQAVAGVGGVHVLTPTVQLPVVPFPQQVSPLLSQPSVQINIRPDELAGPRFATTDAMARPIPFGPLSEQLLTRHLTEEAAVQNLRHSSYLQQLQEVQLMQLVASATNNINNGNNNFIRPSMYWPQQPAVAYVAPPALAPSYPAYPALSATSLASLVKQTWPLVDTLTSDNTEASDYFKHMNGRLPSNNTELRNFLKKYPTEWYYQQQQRQQLQFNSRQMPPQVMAAPAHAFSYMQPYVQQALLYPQQLQLQQPLYQPQYAYPVGYQAAYLPQFATSYAQPEPLNVIKIERPTIRRSKKSSKLLEQDLVSKESSTKSASQLVNVAPVETD